MIRGITYNKQLFKSNDFALMTKKFFDGNDGVVSGCALGTSGNTIAINPGWFIASGYYTNISSQEIVTVDQNGTLVYEIDLSKENTIQSFNQGSFKIIAEDPTKEDLFNGGEIYQMPIATVETDGTVATITEILWGNAKTDAGITNIYEFAIPMSSMVEDLTSGTQRMMASFTKDGDFSNSIVIGTAYKKGQLADRYQSNTNYNIGVRLIDFHLLTSQSLQGGFYVNKTDYDADLEDTFISDKTYYVYVAVLKK